MKSCLLVWSLIVASATWAAAAEARPNALFIVIDNVDFWHLGKCYEGKGLTPQIDRVAREGVTFSRAYATTPLCVPSRYACLTGRYASRCNEKPASASSGDDQTAASSVDSGDDEEGYHCSLEMHLPNLPRVMQKAGYATGFVGKYHLETENYPRFDGDETSIFDPRGDAWLKKRNAWLVEHIHERGFDFVFNALDFRNGPFRGIDFEGVLQNPEADGALGALDFIETNRDRPFFLYLATRLLHLPIDVKLLKKDYSKYGRVTEGGLLPEMPKVPMPPREEIYAAAEKYGAKTSQEFGAHWLDCEIGAVLDRLEQLKILDNTLVIIYSDNNMRGKETLYEGGARVPLVMRWPKHLNAGSVDSHIVANIDFAPTIFDACDIKPPKDMVLDGQSMMPVLTKRKAPWRDALLLENGNTRAVVTDDWKYVALRYTPDVQAEIEEVDRTGEFPRMSRKAEIYFEKFKSTLTPEQWRFARNSWRWHTPGNNYMKSIDDFPFQFDADQLFVVEDGPSAQDEKNVADDPANATVLADMKSKLKTLLEPLHQSFGEFGVPYSERAAKTLPKRLERQKKAPTKSSEN